ncbi:hypothetical protein HOY80DRAFT_1031934 [Tuber brumale]|nr:hypothetical protein HOY80DRAFT_1031934 [Tuber brumale]
MKTGEKVISRCLGKAIANCLKPAYQDSVIQSYSNINTGNPDNEEVEELVLEVLEKVAIRDG